MYKLFSERNKESMDEVDVYSYDNIPTSFRNQLFFIVHDTIDELNEKISNSDIDFWEIIHNGFCREKGLKGMTDGFRYYTRSVEGFIDKSSDTDLLDFIDYAFHYFWFAAQKIAKTNPYYRTESIYQNAISELNERFQQHRLGYEFINEVLIRIDNKFIHHEYVKPALKLLHAKGFEGAEEEFTKAFDALRNHDNKDAIINAEKAFESTMKTICAKRGFSFDPEKDAAKRLISILKDKGYFPGYMEDHLNIVVKALENGAPTIRNKTSGHGQGEEIVEIPESYAEYAIGLVAVNIVFLVDLLSIG